MAGNIVSRVALATALARVATAIKEVAAAIAEQITTKTLTVQQYGYIDSLETDLLHVADQISAGNKVTAPNITAMQSDVDALKDTIKITGVKLYRRTTDTNNHLQVALEVSPRFFGEMPVIGSTCNIRIIVVFTRTTQSLATKAATLKVADDGRAYVETGVYDAGARTFAAGMEATLQISTNLSGAYEVVKEVPMPLLTLIEEA